MTVPAEREWPPHVGPSHHAVDEELDVLRTPRTSTPEHEAADLLAAGDALGEPGFAFFAFRSRRSRARRSTARRLPTATRKDRVRID